MSHPIELSAEAELDLIAVCEWYELQREGLGSELVSAIEAGTHRISQNPNECQVRYRSIRVAYVKRFPYGIHYFVEEGVVKVIAIFHMSQNPQNWDDRK